MTDRPASAGPITGALAAFVARSRYGDLPADVVREARRSIFNVFGTALGGIADEAALVLLRALEPFSGRREASVIGNDARLDILSAAFINAVTMNIADFDDTHEETILHPSAPVAPAILALSEQRPVTGRQLLHAFVLGLEVECRIANAISPDHYRRGWHITSTLGGFGAAMAAGKLLGLDPTQLVWALGNAAMQSAGNVESFGSTSKSVGVGNAARTGLLSAIFAERGVTGPPSPLEGANGFLSLACESPDPSAIVDGLGETWELRRNAYKPYPCGVVLHPVIDACLACRASKLAPAAVEKVTVTGSPLLKKRAERPDVTRGREAQISLQHTVAVTLLRGAPSVADFSDAAVNAPDVIALRARVASIEVDPSLPSNAVRMAVVARGGGTLVFQVDCPKGSLGNPLSDGELEQKFRTLAAAGSPKVDADRLIAKLWNIEALESAADLMALARTT